MQTNTTRSSVGAGRTVSTPAHRSSPRRGGAISLLLLRGPLLHLLPPSASWEAPVEVQGVLKGSLSREPFHSEGRSHTCPHQAHSPRPGTQCSAWTSHLLGESQNPFAWRQHSLRKPGVGPFPLSTQGLNTGTQVDGTTPAGIHGGSGPRKWVSPCELPGGVGQHRPAPHPEDGQAHSCQSRQTRTKATHRHLQCKPLWQAPPSANPSGRLGLPAQPRPPPLSHATLRGQWGPQALGICPQGKA